MEFFSHLSTKTIVALGLLILMKICSIMALFSMALGMFAKGMLWVSVGFGVLAFIFCVSAIVVAIMSFAEQRKKPL